MLTGVTASGSGKNAGSYASTATGSDSNYALSFVDGALVINKANAVVTANSATVTYNGQTQTVSGFTATGLVNGESTSVLTGVTASGSGTTPGTYLTKASGIDRNYVLTFVDGELKIVFDGVVDYSAPTLQLVQKTSSPPIIRELITPVICEPDFVEYPKLSPRGCFN